MTPPDLISLFIAPLNSLGLPYMVTGAVAAIIYGEPRLTRDVDVVVDLQPDRITRLVAAFTGPEFYVAPEEVIAQEMRRDRRGHFNIIHIASSMKADLYTVGTDPLHQWAMSRRQREDVGDTTVWVAPAEYVIVRKLEWYRAGRASRHLDDVRAMLRVSGERVDRTALQEWVSRLDLEAEWREATTPSKS